MATALVAGTALAPLAAAAPAQAYCGSNYTWAGSNLYMKIGSNVPSGWNNAIVASAGQWSNISGASWAILITSAAESMTLRYATPAGGFGGAPGVTTLAISGNTVVSGDVYLNPNWSWNLNGNLNQANRVADVRTITVHELGHELVLEHPNQCGPMSSAEIAAAMNPNYVQKWNVNSDDRAGAAFMK
ncbi:matrixin family metalloprotease [Nocardioides lacusdianchii]|uniref:matrixin family metalloprotease n=1 Tax=Nocardioides lacusdianchii TaxID=2783664 RepID=UPI001CCD4934|nr:matrixin family metalloprotease [Nocardioides lacusdianchii]